MALRVLFVPGYSVHDAERGRVWRRSFRRRIVTLPVESERALSLEFREYVRGEAHTNTIEGYFSILKRGITGTYHHISQRHLKRYLAEFDFRYNERAALGVGDVRRTDLALGGIVGKRLTYRGSSAS